LAKVNPEKKLIYEAFTLYGDTCSKTLRQSIKISVAVTLDHTIKELGISLQKAKFLLTFNIIPTL